MNKLFVVRSQCKCGQGMYTAGQEMYRTCFGIKNKSLMSLHPLTNLEIINYSKDEPRFNRVYSRNNLPKTTKRCLCH